ncbi:MAG TPA: tetratricopeptide repeat protein [Myxococcaceae bacterium]|jgi:tetratricopeptide (TPR) repeat protein
MTQTELSQRGFEQLKAGNYEEARRLFQQNEEKAGSSAETKSLLKQAAEALAKNEPDVAAELYEKVLERNPTLVEAYLGLSRISLATGELEAAQVHAIAATSVAPEVGLGWTLLGLVDESNEDLDAALEKVSKGVKLSPSEYLCQFNYGRVLAVAEQPEEGVPALQKATELQPSNPDAFYMLGMVAAEAGQDDLAIKSFRKVTQLAPDNVDGWATLGDVLFGKRLFDEARQVLDQGLEACGDNPALLEKAIATAITMGDVQGAIDYVQRELEVVPDHEQGWFNLAQFYLLTEDYEKSEQTAQQLLKVNPKSWEAWFHLGNLYEAMPLEQKSEEAYRKAIELGPDEWKPLANLGALLVQMQDRSKNSEAVPLLEQAQMIAPKDEYLVPYNLALAHTRLGKKDRALELTRKLLREVPEDDELFPEVKKLESNLLEAGAR